VHVLSNVLETSILR